MKTASWIIVELDTGKPVFETFDPTKVAALNTAKYKAVPILEWLQAFNRMSDSERAAIQSIEIQ